MPAQTAKKQELPAKMDDFAEEVFKAFGFKEPFPQELVTLHNRVKRLSDQMRPGRMCPEAYAIIAILAVDRVRASKEAGQP